MAESKFVTAVVPFNSTDYPTGRSDGSYERRLVEDSTGKVVHTGNPAEHQSLLQKEIEL